MSAERSAAPRAEPTAELASELAAERGPWPRTIAVPEQALVLLVGPSGSGKSTFARAHFAPTEVVSSDRCRALVADDENDQSATEDAFALLHTIVERRLARGRLTVVDATSVQPEARAPLVALARRRDVAAVAIVLDLPERELLERHRRRSDRAFGAHVIRQHRRLLEASLPELRREGFRHVHVLRSAEDVARVRIERQPLPSDRRGDRGPFDIVGDVHGCADELEELLATLGYAPDAAGVWRHPGGRRAIFLGDLVDRGPRVPDVLRIVMGMVEAGTALCLPGNHDDKLVRKLRGRNVKVRHGMEQTLEQLAAEPSAFRGRVAGFLGALTEHYVLDEGRLVVAHAGMKAALQGRASGRVRDFALYGETTGETDVFGLPVRYDWAADYRGEALVVYGHTPVPEPRWLNGTINVDTGCVFGGRLTALRYPERELVSVAARRTYAISSRPFLPAPDAPEPRTAQQRHDDVLDVADVAGRRLVRTRLLAPVPVREDAGGVALEVLGRFGADPRWLVYLPPSMTPPEPSADPAYLEHPREALAHYRHHGVPGVVCEALHPGTRAVLVVCRDEGVARRRFGVEGDGLGACFTRAGRRAFDDPAREAALLADARAALDRAGLWARWQTDWVCLDGLLTPAPGPGADALRRRYAAAAATARAGLDAALEMLHLTLGRGVDVTALLSRTAERRALASRYAEAVARFLGKADEPAEETRFAPVQLLATEEGVHLDDRRWQLEDLATLTRASAGALAATAHRLVDVTDAESAEAAVRWWEEHTEAGGAGLVFKPLVVAAGSRRGPVQPALKVRGREYLRLSCGAEYTRPEMLAALRARGLERKRAVAARQFALGIEALERFGRAEPLRRVHECVFAILALESEAVDSTL